MFGLGTGGSLGGTIAFNGGMFVVVGSDYLSYLSRLIGKI